MAAIRVRYFVNDVDETIAFYTQHLGFTVKAHPAPFFAILQQGECDLLINAVSGPSGATQPMPDGRRPEPGGWNRIQLVVKDLDGLVDTLRKAGLRFRNELTAGVGGKQILLEDPSGNPIELFEPSS